MQTYPPNNARPGDIFENSTGVFVAVYSIFSDVVYLDGRGEFNRHYQIKWIRLKDKNEDIMERK